ncbi:septal ring lytic transglycosylase RlpA family protein [Croceibacterium aestuarii]|uniref:septal ring lytic transglycosylase RlpA family protein n=1 Tax=Croceibacterium aestuarii TaxID=3064139 RepID=UPI00272E3F38|nr:septal ring lytic transglycosylase RlpA family protein [Croceibacterium sp. D39]
MDRRIITPLRAALATAALLALGATVAPGYAEDNVPAPAATIEAPIDPALPQFAPQGDDAALVADDTADDAAQEAMAAEGEAWEAYGSGMASWYGPKFKGRKTASGETFDPTQLTAAHRTLPFGTKVRVTRGGKSVVVRVNDRGPFARSRVIDVSQAAAKQLGLIGPGHGTVTLAVLDN